MTGERDALRRRFEADLHEAYRTAVRDIGYHATAYLRMLHEHGGVATATRLLAGQVESYGFERLREAGRLDLSVEASVLKPEFAPLFQESQREVARFRLADARFDVAGWERRPGGFHDHE